MKSEAAYLEELFANERLLCISDVDKVNLQGEILENVSSNLQILVSKCQNETSSVTCRTDEEIDEFLSNVMLITLRRDQVYNQDKFGDETVSDTIS